MSFPGPWNPNRVNMMFQRYAPYVMSGAAAYNAAKSVLGKRTYNAPAGNVYSRGVPGKKRRYSKSVPATSVGTIISARTGSRNLTKYKKRKKKYRGAFGKTQRKAIKAIVGRISDNAHMNAKKYLSKGQITWSANQCKYHEFGVGDRGTLDDALGATTMMYRDDLGNSGLDEYDMTQASSTAMYKYKFVQILQRIQVRNNWSMPIKLKCYWVRPKRTQDTTWLTDYSLVNDRGSVFAATDPRYFPCDSYGARQNWITYKTQTYLVNAGDEVEIIQKRKKPRWYSPNDHDDDDQEYRKGLYQAVVFRFEGVPCHDADTHTEIGLSDGTVDYVRRIYYKWCTMPSGTRSTFLHEGTTDFGTIATAAVVGPTIQETKESG